MENLYTTEKNSSYLTREQYIQENRNLIKDYLEKVIKNINNVDFRFVNVLDLHKNIEEKAKRIILKWENPNFRNQKNFQVDTNKRKSCFTENPRYIFTQFLRYLIDKVIYRQDLTFKEIEWEINKFEKETKVRFLYKRTFLLLSFSILKEEEINLEQCTYFNWVLCVISMNLYYFKTRVLNLILWEI